MGRLLGDTTGIHLQLCQTSTELADRTVKLAEIGSLFACQRLRRIFVLACIGIFVRINKVDVVDDESFRDFWGTIAEGDLAEDTIGECFAQILAVRDVGGQEYYMSDVAGRQPCRPLRNLFINHGGAGLVALVEEVLDDHDGASFGVVFEVFVIAQLGVFVILRASFQGNGLEGGCRVVPDLAQLVFECLRESSLDASRSLGGKVNQLLWC